MVKGITRRRFAQVMCVTGLGIAGGLTIIGSGNDGPQPSPTPDIEPSIDSLTLNDKTENIMLKYSEDAYVDVTASGSRIPLKIYVRTKDRAGNEIVGLDEYMHKGSSLTDLLLDFKDITGLMKLEGVVQDNEGIGAADSLNFTRISHDNLIEEWDNNPYNAKYIREIIGDWSLIASEEYGSKLIPDGLNYFVDYVGEVVRQEIASLEEMLGTPNVGNAAARYLVLFNRFAFLLNTDTTLKMLYELTGFDTNKAVGFTNDNKYGTVKLSTDAFIAVDDITKHLTGVDDIIDVVKDTKPEGAELYGPGIVEGEDVEYMTLECDERILHSGNFFLSVIHNPTAEELTKMQKVNEAGNEEGGGVTAVYDNDSRLVVFTRMNKAYKILQNPQEGVTIPLNNPKPIQVSALNKLLAPVTFLAACYRIGCDASKEMGKPNDNL